MSSDQHTKISDRSWIPLGKALAIGIGLFSGGYAVAQALASFERRLERMEVSTSEQWTVTDMERWGYMIEKNNRNVGQQPLWVPDPRDVKRLAPK